MSSTLLAQSRGNELAQNLTDILNSISHAVSVSDSPARSKPTLVAVSKLKPTSDILHCFNAGQLDFGENYVQECVDKAKELPTDIRWHFIGPLQSNKAKYLASIPNLYAFHTLSSSKVATLLSKHLSPDRKDPLKVFIQINTSFEDSKSGLAPLTVESRDSEKEELLVELCRHVAEECPGLHLTGLMTIGSLAESTSSSVNEDFKRLQETRVMLEERLSTELPSNEAWGELVQDLKSSETKRQLTLSMGMSSDFEDAIRQGSNFVRVGSSIFGAREMKK